MNDLEMFKNNIEIYCNQAIEIGKSTIGATFDKSLKSLEEMDKVVDYLNNLYKKLLIDDRTTWNLSTSLGVLLGEIMLNTSLAIKGYEWILNEQNIPVVANNKNGNASSPITKIYKIIISTENNEGTPTSFYRTYLMML